MPPVSVPLVSVPLVSVPLVSVDCVDDVPVAAGWRRGLLAVVAPAREDDVGHDEDDDRAHDDGQALEIRESGLIFHDREE